LEALFSGALVNSASRTLVTNMKDYGDFRRFLQQISREGAGLVPPTAPGCSPRATASGSALQTDARSAGGRSSSPDKSTPSPSKSPSSSGGSTSVSPREQRELDRECKGGDPNCHRHANFGVVCRCGGLPGPPCPTAQGNPSAPGSPPAAVFPPPPPVQQMQA
jgi:hypothetical protein